MQPARSIVLADWLAVALASIATVLVLYAMAHAGDLAIPRFLWFVMPPVLAGLTLYCVHQPKALKLDTQEWVGALFGTVLLGAVFFAIDVVLGSMHGNYRSLLETGFHAGGPFGIVLTVMICPVGTIISLGGLVRHIVLGSSREEMEEPS